MNCKLKLAIIAHSYLPVSGGIQTYIHAKAVEFVKLGHEVHVIVPNNHLAGSTETIIDGVKVHRTSVANIDWSYPVADNTIGGWNTNRDHQPWGAQVVQMAMETLAIITREHFDLVHTHFTATFVGELLWLFHGIPYVDSIYGFYTDYHPSEEMRHAARHFYRHGNMRSVIVVGNHVKNHCIDGGIPEALLRVVYPSVDFDRFDSEISVGNLIERYQLPIQKGTKIIFSPIRLQERKGFITALYAFALARREYPDAHLIISGGSSANPAGIDKPMMQFKSISAELDIEAQVSLLLNRIDDLDMPAFYRLADVVFMPSLQEGFGIAMLEALAMQRPIVATNIPPFRESTAGYAQFFEPKDAEGAAKALISTFSMPPYIVRQVEQGYRHVRQEYNAANLAEQMIEVYEEALANV